MNSRVPMTRLGSYEVSRLIVGANPFYGYSHFNRLFSSHMVEWFTPERVWDVLRQCESAGINTWQFSHSPRSISDLQKYRAGGGKIQWMLLSDRVLEEDLPKIDEVAKLKPIGIIHHGGTAERRRRAGQMGKIQEFLKRVRGSGVMVGLSAHDPDLIREVESRDWDIDFYMCSLYYLTRSPDEFRKLMGTRPIGEVYLPEDPAKMCEVIRQTKRTCLAYKVLAAGRIETKDQVDRAFQFAYEHIKPQDALIVGMYPRYSDQITENAERARKWAVRA